MCLLVECGPRRYLPFMPQGCLAAPRHFRRMPASQRVAIVGVGLIGGSIGLALRERGLAAEVVGVGRRQASLDRALACGTDRPRHDQSGRRRSGGRLGGCGDPCRRNRRRRTLGGASRRRGRRSPTPAAPKRRFARNCAARTVAKTLALAARTVHRQPPDCRRPPHGARTRPGGSVRWPHRRRDARGRHAAGTGRAVPASSGNRLAPNVELLSPEEHDRALGADQPPAAPGRGGAGRGDARGMAASGRARLGRHDAHRRRRPRTVDRRSFSRTASRVLDALRRFEHRLATLDEALAEADAAALVAELQDAKRIREALDE